MSKKNYILTICDYGYKVEAWDKYGKYVCVYEKTREDASKFILDYWHKLSVSLSLKTVYNVKIILKLKMVYVTYTILIILKMTQL